MDPYRNLPIDASLLPFDMLASQHRNIVFVLTGCPMPKLHDVEGVIFLVLPVADAPVLEARH